MAVELNDLHNDAVARERAQSVAVSRAEKALIKCFEGGTILDRETNTAVFCAPGKWVAL